MLQLAPAAALQAACHQCHAVQHAACGAKGRGALGWTEEGAGLEVTVVDFKSRACHQRWTHATAVSGGGGCGRDSPWEHYVVKLRHELDHACFGRAPGTGLPC